MQRCVRNLPHSSHDDVNTAPLGSPPRIEVTSETWDDEVCDKSAHFDNFVLPKRLSHAACGGILCLYSFQLLRMSVEVVLQILATLSSKSTVATCRLLWHALPFGRCMAASLLETFQRFRSMLAAPLREGSSWTETVRRGPQALIHPYLWYFREQHRERRRSAIVSLRQGS